MRPRVALRVLALALASAVLPLSLAHATHSPTVAQVVAAAQGLGMSCETLPTAVDCTGPAQYYFRNPGAVIHPGSGSLVDVVSKVDPHVNGAHELSPEDQAWMTTLHTVGCVDQNGVAVLLRDLNAMFANASSGGTYGPIDVGECRMLGTFVMPSRFCQAPDCYYTVTSTVLGTAFPTPTPAPTPPPTPAPTPPPVVTPPPAATASLGPSATPRPSASATPGATATTPPPPTPAALPTRTPRPSPSATPEQTVAGITFAPEPSAAAPDVAEDSIPWASSVHGPADVSSEPAAIGASAAMAMLLLLFMGFVGELFNNTVKTNYDELIGWWQKSWPGRLTAAWARLWRPRP